MLIARAPVRISLAGGGTDLPDYYSEHGGLVVSTTIDKYFYVIVKLNGTDWAEITSSDYGSFFRQQGGAPIRWAGELGLPRAFLNEFGIDSGVSLFLASEVPPGTGLGSSSAVAVALGKALSTLLGMSLDREELAELASHVEINKLGMPIGKQDQYAAAFGGLNAIRFERDEVTVSPLRLAPEVRDELERRTMLFFTGQSRNASSILSGQRSATQRGEASVIESLHQIKGMAERTIDLLNRGDLDGFGELLNESWTAKKRLAEGITNHAIDSWYETALQAGAIGGKIAGAGGGGFLMVHCQKSYQNAVTDALEGEGLVRVNVHFEDTGAEVLMDAMPRIKPAGLPCGSLADRSWMKPSLRPLQPPLIPV